MGFLYFLCIVAAITISCFVAKEFSDIAEMKGHAGEKYFWFTLLLGVVGMLMVAALPNVTPIQTSAVTPLPTKQEAAAWLKNASTNIPKDPQNRCPHCGETVKNGKCEMCGRDVT